MKAIYLSFALLASMSASAQTPAPAPSVPSDPGPLFQVPSSPGKPSPRFRWQLPKATQPFALQGPVLVKPVPRQPANQTDSGMVKHPQGFAQHPGTAVRQNLYPGLTLMPTEEARLVPPAGVPGVKAEPIPRTFPKAKVEAIPTEWPCYRMMPVDSSASASPACK